MADLSAKEVDYEACEIGARALGVLQDLLRSRPERLRVAALTGIPEKTLTDYFNGRTSPTVDRFLLIAVACGVPPADFFEDRAAPMMPIGEPPQAVLIPILDVEAAAGSGSAADVVRAEAEFPFPQHFLRRLLGDMASRARLECLRAKGDSMAPTIADGALLMVDRTQSSLPDPTKTAKNNRHRIAQPDIYVFFQGDGLRLKRLQRLDRDFVAIHSDNKDEFPPEIFHLGRDGTLKVIGKVVWWDNRL